MNKNKHVKTGYDFSEEIEDFDSFWVDDEKLEALKEIVSVSATKYNILIGEWLDPIALRLYEDFFSVDQSMDKKTREAQRIRTACDLMNFFYLTGDAKVSTPRETIFISIGGLKKIQDLIAPVIDEVMNLGTLIGYTPEEKYRRLNELAAEAEFKRDNFFNAKLRDYVKLLASMGLFQVPKKGLISDVGGAFLYDVFFTLKYSMGADLPIDWRTQTKSTAPAETNAEKRKVIMKRLKGKKLERKKIE